MLLSTLLIGNYFALCILFVKIFSADSLFAKPSTSYALDLLLLGFVTKLITYW